MFITDPSQDPFFDQFVMGIYGRPGVGKTELLMDLARSRQEYVYLLSVDRGITRFRRDFQAFKGRLIPVYVLPTSQEQEHDSKAGEAFSFVSYLYRRVAEIVDHRIPALIAKGIPASKIWFCIDTLSHMQKSLLREGQEEMIQSGSPSNFRTQMADAKGGGLLPSRVKAELITSPEWGANQAVMSAVTDYCLRLPCNVIFLMLEKSESVTKDTRKITPDIQGATASKVMGDLDILARMVSGSSGTRSLRFQPNVSYDAKDRFDCLPDKMGARRLKDGEVIPILRQIRNACIDGIKQENTEESE